MPAPDWDEIMATEEYQKAAAIRDAAWAAQGALAPAFENTEIGSLEHAALLDVLNRLVAIRVKREDECLRMVGH